MKTITTLRFTGDWSVWLTIVTGLLLAGAAWWFYRRETRGILPALRASAVFLLVLMLAGAVLHHRRTTGELAHVLVFVDASQSMSIRDDFMDDARKQTVLRAAGLARERFDAMTRWQRLDHLLLQSDKAVLPALADKFNVEVATLAGRKLWSTIQGTELPGALPAAPEDGVTAFSGILPAKAEQRTAIVLLSDGQENAGGSPVELARVAQSRGIPIFTVGLGALDRPRDLAIVAVDAPDSVAADDRLKGTLTLKDDMPPGQSFTVRIGDMWKKTLVTDHSHHRKVEFDFPVTEIAGPVAALKVTVSPVAGEYTITNNEDTLHFRVASAKRKLLLVDGRARWEFRYLRNLFERDKHWEVTALLPDSRKFPDDRETLFSYDLIGFGEVPREFLDDDQLGWIRDFVSVRGGGVFFIDGQRGALREFVHSPLAALLPVEWINPKGDRPERLQLTGAGAALGPLALVSDDNAALWRELPAPHWIAGTRALPGTETLVEAMVNGRPVPALVLRRFGAGQVLYAGLDETWRWRYDVGDKYFAPFWNQITDWIAEPMFAACDNTTALDAGPLNDRAGQTAEIRARLRDERGRPVARDSVEAFLYRDGKKAATITLKVDGSGNYRGKTEPLATGNYEVGLEALRVPVFVHAAEAESGEMSELTCNEELLRQMAQLSGGEYFREEDAARLVDRLAPFSEGRVEESDTVLWQSWWWFAPVIALFTAEWILRKRKGLL